MIPSLTRRAALGLAGLVLFTSAAAAQDANVTIVHGIRGQDLNLAPELPVDVTVNGGCLLSGFEFGDVAGPLQLPAGTYDIRISLADTQNPCSNGAVIEATVDFAAGENATVIAHLDETGAPTASKFVFDLSSSSAGSRIFVHHTAAAPAVDAGLRRVSPGRGSKLLLFGVVNGLQGQGDVAPGQYRIGVAVAGTDRPVLGPLQATFDEGFAYQIYVVGSANNQSLTALVVPSALQ